MPEVFYNMYLRKKETVPDNKIKVKQVNGRFQLIGTSKNGKQLYKFASEETAKKYKQTGNLISNSLLPSYFYGWTFFKSTSESLEI